VARTRDVSAACPTAVVSDFGLGVVRVMPFRQPVSCWTRVARVARARRWYGQKSSMGLAPPARHRQRDAIPIETTAHTAIGPREWRSHTRPVLDLNAQASSEYASRQRQARYAK
jgi:hypothetical protein